MRASLSVLLLLAAAATSRAQEPTTRSLPSVQFTFGNPGARSLGMGGAFLGLADDASAAEANPAGLTVLQTTEISVELRGSSESKSVPLRGSFPDVERGTFTTDTRPSELAFASVVLPLPRVALAAYYHRVASFQSSDFLGEPVTYHVAPGGAVTAAECQRLGSTCTSGALLPESANIGADLETFGVAAAKAFGKFSAGAALRYVTYTQSGMIVPFDTTGRVIGAFSQIADGGDINFSLGVKWKPLDTVSVGAVYKAGSDFSAPVYFQPVGAVDRILLADVRRRFPVVAGAGISIRPGTSLTFNADAIRIGYRRFGESVAEALTSDEPASYQLDDATEIRFGAEYFILTKIPIGVRAGWWRDPAHSLSYAGPVNTLQGVAAAIVFPPSKSQDHYSVGVGMAWPRFQLDAAYDTSRNTRTGSLSLVARF